MKKIGLVLLFALFGINAMAQQDDPAKLNQWITTYQKLNEEKDWSAMLAQQGKCKLDVPHWDMVYYFVGVADYNLKQYDNAVMNLSIFIQKNQTIPAAYLLRAHSYVEQKNPKDAIADYNKYLEMTPNDVAAMQSKANAYKEMNDYQSYIKTLSEVLVLEPKNVSALSNKAAANAMIKNWDDAIVDYTSLIELEPTNKENYSSRAFAYYSLRTPESLKKAAVDYLKVIELGGYEEKTYTALYTIYSMVKDYASEISVYDKILEVKKDVDLLYRRGAAKFNSSDFKGAIADFDKVLEEKVDHINALKRRATAKTKLGDKQGAQADALKIKELEGAKQ